MKMTNIIFAIMILSLACDFEGGSQEEHHFSVELQNGPLIMAEGDTLEIECKIIDEYGIATNVDAEYTNHESEIAAIYSSGWLIAKEAGIFPIEMSSDYYDTVLYAYITELPIERIEINPSPVFVRSDDTMRVAIRVFDIEAKPIIEPQIPFYLRIIGNNARIDRYMGEFYIIEGISGGESIIEASLCETFDCEFFVSDTVFVIDLPTPPGCPEPTVMLN